MPGGVEEREQGARGWRTGAWSGRETRARAARPGPPHSPEARAGSPGAAAPPGLRRRRRRLQRPRQGRIMRPHSWPGRRGPRGSARSCRAGRREAASERTRETEPNLESLAARPPEVNLAWSAAPRLRSSGRAAPGSGERSLRWFAGTQRPGSLWDRGL